MTDGDGRVGQVAPARPHLVLIGPPGAGKSTVGRLVAQAMGLDFTDTDDVVAERAGRTISDIFIVDGEAHFRELEREAVAEALQHPGIVAFGGGAVLDPRTEQDLVASGMPVVFLDVRIADAASRVGFAVNRPLMAVNPRAQWTTLMNDRRPIYTRLATAVVQTGGRTPQDVAAEVARQIASSAPPGGR